MSWETQFIFTVNEFMLGLTFGIAFYVVKIDDRLEKIQNLLEEKNKKVVHS